MGESQRGAELLTEEGIVGVDCGVIIGGGRASHDGVLGAGDRVADAGPLSWKGGGGLVVRSAVISIWREFEILKDRRVLDYDPERRVNTRQDVEDMDDDCSSRYSCSQ